MMMPKRRIGIVGFGHIGQFVLKRLLDPSAPESVLFDVVFVWNRTRARLDEAEALIGSKLPDGVALENLADFAERGADLIIEVAHPAIYDAYGELFLREADLFVGSPTALARGDVFARLQALAKSGPHALWLPCGALWGSTDVLRMGARNAVARATITMRKPAGSMRLEPPLQEALDAFVADETAVECELYRGPVRGVCALAPNNVNTMACFAIATGETVGFDKCEGVLVADKRLRAHVIELEVVGHPPPGRDDAFTVSVRRVNPCNPTEVTASATYPSFLASICAVAGQSRCSGVHFI